MPLLSIVVPTRDRAETAWPCIRYLLTLPGDDFEIVVTDCSAGSELRDALATIDDPRLVYASIAPCSMTDNFNNGYAHSRGDYVVFIGDDDAFLASGLDTVRRLGRDDVDAIAWPYRAAYHWDNFPDPALAGTLVLTGMAPDAAGRFVGAPEREGDARACMLAELHGNFGGAMPVVYHGVVARRHLDTIAARAGALFHTRAPDTYVAAALCTFIGRYTVVDRPLSVFGKSGRSNSARLLRRDDLLQHRGEFAAQEQAFDPLVAPIETAEGYIADSFITAFKAMDDAQFIDVFVRRWLARSYSDSLRRNPQRIGAILAHLAGPARRSDRRVATPGFAAALIGHMARRIGARIVDRIGTSTGTTNEVVSVPSYEGAIALVEARLS